MKSNWSVLNILGRHWLGWYCDPVTGKFYITKKQQDAEIAGNLNAKSVFEKCLRYCWELLEYYSSKGAARKVVMHLHHLGSD